MQRNKFWGSWSVSLFLSRSEETNSVKLSQLSSFIFIFMWLTRSWKNGATRTIIFATRVMRDRNDVETQKWWLLARLLFFAPLDDGKASDCLELFSLTYIIFSFLEYLQIFFWNANLWSSLIKFENIWKVPWCSELLLLTRMWPVVFYISLQCSS